MSEERVSLMEPPIEELLDKVDSKFTLVTLSARRGRQINSYFNQLGEGLGSIVPPQVSSSSRKPLTIALEEIAAGKIATKAIEATAVEEEASGEDASAILGMVGGMAGEGSGQHGDVPSDEDAVDGLVEADTTIIGDTPKA